MTEAGASPRILTRAILFDMDGVLADSTRVIEKSWSEWALANNVDAPSLLGKVHGRKAVEVLADYVSPSQIPEHLAILIAQEIRWTSETIVLPGADVLLNTLPVEAWGVVTSAPREIALPRLQAAGLPAPRVLVCAEDVAQGKPSPEGYLKAASMLGFAADDCLVVEDAPAGIAAGKAAAMRVLALTTTHAADDLRDADYVASSLADVSVTGIDAQIGLRLKTSL